jgi:ankyrin repeat protein
VWRYCSQSCFNFDFVFSGLPWTLQLLNAKGLDLNQADSVGATPLHLCAMKNLHRPVRMLVDSGAEVNAKHGKTQLTPLQMACSHAHPDVETIRSFLDKVRQFVINCSVCVIVVIFICIFINCRGPIRTGRTSRAAPPSIWP